MQKKLKILTFTLLLIISLTVFFVFRTTSDLPPTQSIPQTPQSKESALTIVAFGDSLTAGYGIPLAESYPMILEQKLNDQKMNVKILNMGVSGETTDIAIERMDFVNKQNPDIILLGLGANDMLRSLPPEKTHANLEKIIIFFQKENKKIILLGMKSTATNGTTYRTSFDAIYPDLAKKYSLPLVPFFLDGVVLNKELNTSDGIHPNYLGYQKIVEKNILPVVLPYLTCLLSDAGKIGTSQCQ